jgi:hypothetical protein
MKMRFLAWFVFAGLVTVSCSRHIERSKGVGAVAGNAYVEAHPEPYSPSALLYADSGHIRSILGKPISQQPLIKKTGKLQFYLGETVGYKLENATVSVVYVDDVCYSVTYQFATPQPEGDLLDLVTVNTGSVNWKKSPGWIIQAKSPSGILRLVFADYKSVRVTAPEFLKIRFRK